MNPDGLTHILREALVVTALISAPVLLVAAAVGFAIAVFQAMTQIQDQTISHVPKQLAVFLTIALAGPWMLAQAVRFTQIMFQSIASIR